MERMTATSRDDNPHTTSFGSQLLWSGVNVREDLILPEQFFSLVRLQDKHRGEVALLYAILGDAIHCFLEGREKQRRDRSRAAREAEAWLFVDDENWPFSFINICELLDLNPTSLRLHLKCQQQASAPRKPPAIYLDPQTCVDESRTKKIRRPLKSYVMSNHVPSSS